MRRGILFIVTLPVMLAGFVMAASPAFADNAHFVGASASVSGTNLVVSFHEAGLGTNEQVHFVANANATATLVCVNKGGGNPSASNKTQVSGPVTAEGTFSSGKNGNINQSLTLMPPPPPSDFSCPKGQSVQTAQVTYTNVSVTDTTNNLTEPVPGTFSTGCLLPGVRGACD
jgi:hypothetical protein